MVLRPDWSREWRGETVLVAASGPSQCKEDLDYARGRCRVVAINSTWRLAPWADVLYFCDADWWLHDGPRGSEFKGRQIVGKPDGPETAGFFSANVTPADTMIWDGEQIGGGHNSGFQILNLLTLWDVGRVIYTGLDCQPRAECNPGANMHWHGLHPHRNPQESTFKKWRLFFSRAAPEVAARGVEVLNASRETALGCFPRVNLRDVL